MRGLALALALLASAAAARAAEPYDAEETAVAALVDLARADRASLCAYCRAIDPSTDCAAWGANDALPPLHYEPVAADAARFHSREMRDAPCFQHDSCCELEKRADGTVGCRAPACDDCEFPTTCPGTATHDRYVLLGYPAQAGENIAVGYPHALDVVCGWMNSPGHRANILGDYDDLGVGLDARGASCQADYWTQTFGARPDRPAPGYLPAGGMESGSPGAPFGEAHRAATAMAFVSDDRSRAPGDVRAVVDGDCVPLDLALGSGGHGLYSASFDVAGGCHELWFLARDADGVRHVFPTDEAIAFSIDGTSCPRPNGRTPAACEGADACSTEGATRRCYDGPAGTEGVGLCHAGHETCVDGAFGACTGEVVPQAETCDGEDDDCDGTVDDAPVDEGAACTTTLPGACAEGHATCVGGGLACAPNRAPAPETCNGVDDDCDGLVDDGLGELDCGCGVVLPACAHGRPQSCASTTPVPEICGNGLDDDCDGTVDDGCPCTGGPRSCYAGPPSTLGVGACKAGIQECENGVWGACVGEVLPAVESCNGVDDDCNGIVDDGFGRETCGVGACRTTGARCAGGEAETCRALAPSAERCNGIDDDCDGVVDDGCVCRPGATTPCFSGDWSTVGVGLCRAGARTCAADGRGFGPCVGEIAAAKETCGNGLDDDCNGLVDDGCPAPAAPDGGEDDRPRAPRGCGCATPFGSAFALLALVRRRRPLRRAR